MSEPKRKSVGEGIIRASLIVGLAHFCMKFMGLVQTRFATQYLDTTQYDVIYGVVFMGIIYTAFLISEESIGPAFLPIFVDARDKDSEEAAWLFSSIVLTLQTIVLVIFSLLIACFPLFFLTLLTDWDPVVDKEKFALAQDALQRLSPAILFLSLGSTTYMILNGYKRFFLAAFGDASWKIVTVLSLAIGIGVFDLGYRALLFGLLLGSVAKLLTHLVGMLREVRRFRFRLDLSNPHFRRMVALTIPLLAGILFAKFRDYFNTIYILTPLKTEGLIQANDVGRKLFMGIAALVPYTVGIAMFPFLCELVDREDKAQLGDVLTKTCRMLVVAFVPVALVVALMARPIVTAVFLGGKFDMTSVGMAAMSTACYTLVLPAYAIEIVLMQGFFASRKTLSITVIGVVFSILSVLICYYFIVILGYTGVHALAAVALSYTVTRSLKVLAMIIVLKGSVPMFPQRPSLIFLLQSLIHGAVILGLAWGTFTLTTHVLGGDGSRIKSLIHVGAAGGVSAVAFFAVAWAIRLDEPFELLRWGRDKILRRRGKTPAA